MEADVDAHRVLDRLEAELATERRMAPGLETSDAGNPDAGGLDAQVAPGWTREDARDKGSGAPYVSLSDPTLVLQQVTNLLPVKFMQHYRFFPLRIEHGVLTLVMADPTDVDTIDSIRLQSDCEVEVCRGNEQEILQALQDYYGSSSSMERIVSDIKDIEHDAGSPEDRTEDIAQLKDLASEAPVIRLVNLMISTAMESRASDIHIEPFEKTLRVRYRIDGVLADSESPPKRLQAAILSRIKLMARMNIAERRLPQDGRIRVTVEGKDLDLRVSTIPTVHGESLVMRLLDRSSVLPGLGQLGFPPDARERFEALITKPHGIILVTGPTGSGKTTTLYAALQKIDAIEKKVITIEDPVEYQLEGVNQIQVKPSISLTFASGLRHIVRQDPDVILVGEIRDLETAEIAIHAALTGHLVLSTLHTNDAAGAVTRLLDMGIEDYLVSSTLLAVLAQRLVRQICQSCKTPYTPEVQTLRDLGVTPSGAHPISLFRGNGCAACHATGYFGRMGIFELLLVDTALQRLILARRDANAIRAEAMKLGMRTLWQDGCAKVVAGITTQEEVLRVTREE
jgi:general secretion pathway protein E